MNELFTFNSRQLKAQIRRPASTDNPPNIRKKIIKSTLSKRLEQLADLSHPKEEDLPPSKDTRLTPVKKVTFNLKKPDNSDQESIYEKLQITKRSKSTERKNIKPCSIDAVWKKVQLSRSPLQDIKNDRKTPFQDVRSLSIAEGRSIQSESIKTDKLIGRLGDRRINSVKLSPKIVPVSDSKLPKAFKIKYMLENNVQKPEKPKSNLRDILSCEIERKMATNEGSLSAKANSVFQLQKMLKIEAKIFQKLYHPRQ